ncbi:MAG: class II aldolase/adducin family protein [Ktedonobacteraceae bacterium]
MLLPELRGQLAHYARKMYESGLVRATQGNLSARDPKSRLICVTPSGADYQALTAEDIAVVDEHGAVVEARWKPSVETPLHTYILRQRPDIHCVMHTHSVYASAFGVVYQSIPMILCESASCLGSEVPVAPYRTSGTIEFAEEVAAILGNGSAVIWGNHGAMVVGTGLAQAFSTAHALEDTAHIYVIAKQLGNPVVLPTEEITKLHLDWKQNYRQKAVEDPQTVA